MDINAFMSGALADWIPARSDVLMVMAGVLALGLVLFGIGLVVNMIRQAGLIREIKNDD